MTDDSGDYEQLCTIGREAAKALDKGRWLLGDLVLKVEKQYGWDTIGRFANDCNISKRSAQQYRQCSEMVQAPGIAPFLTSPVLCWSLFRICARLPEEERITFLETCAANALTIEQAELMVATRKNGTRRVKVAEFEGVPVGDVLQSFDIPPGTDLQPGQTYHIVIYAEETIIWNAPV